LSANIVAQNPCDNTMPPLLPGQVEADIIIIGGGASAAGVGTVAALAARLLKPRTNKRFMW